MNSNVEDELNGAEITATREFLGSVNVTIALVPSGNKAIPSKA